MIHEISCGIIPVYMNQFLLVQHHAGHWAFPKGHQEVGESYIETAERELAEETGLEITSYISDEIISESYEFMRKGKAISKTVHYFMAEVSSKEVSIQDEEIQDYFWGSADEVMERITFAENRELFKRALDLKDTLE